MSKNSVKVTTRLEDFLIFVFHFIMPFRLVTLGFKNLKQYSISGNHTTTVVDTSLDFDVPHSVSVSTLGQSDHSLQSIELDALRVTPEEFQCSLDAIFQGKTGQELFLQLPKTVPKAKIPLLQACFTDALERFICHSDALPAQNNIEMSERMSEAYNRSKIQQDLLMKCAYLENSDLEQLPNKILIEEKWNGIVKDQKCLLCIDLLAAPVILSCSHSFCGSCLHNYMNHKSDEDKNVGYFCPTCRHQIESKSIYERHLDTSIVNQVDNLGFSCEQIDDWRIRRNEHIERMKISVNKRDCNYEEEDDDYEGSSFENLESFLKWAIPFVAVFIVCLVSVRRGQRTSR